MARSLLAAVVVGLLALPDPARAHDFKIGAIDVEHPWSRATPGSAKVAAGYLTLKNGGDAPDRLVSASAEIAASTEIHEMRMAHGVMQMRPLPEGVVVPAGGEVALQPGGNHLMFLGLNRPLVEGESFAAKLTFERAGSVEVTFKVEGVGAPAPASSGHDHH